MITPIKNISFGNIKKIKSQILKTEKTPIKTTNSINCANINFGQYIDIKRPVSFEQSITENWFKLPEITLEDGEKRQIMPDKSQIECAKHLFNDENVVFNAPTGMGKTAIAHYAINNNLQKGKKTIYTVPIKALANDKYNEFTKIYGEKNVGILTGDRKINPTAPVTIMVEEILNNQMLSMSQAQADKIGTVIFDEAHYLGDEERGMAWENTIINAMPKGIQTLYLSATIGNCDDFKNWIASLNKTKETARVEVSPQSRPVPLIWHLFKSDEEELVPVSIGQIDLSKELPDYTYDIQNLIYDSEIDFWQRKQAQNPQNETPKQLKDKFYNEIPDILSEKIGPNWLSADFSDKSIQRKLLNEFPSLTEIELKRIAYLSDISGIKSLTDGQKTALEILFRSEYENNPNYMMTNNDFDFIYQQLKLGIGDGHNNFKYTTETFKKKLKNEFKNLDNTQLDQVTQLMAQGNKKQIRAIHQNWQKDDFATLINKLQQKDMLPAIIFKLAQGGCEQTAKNLLGDEGKTEDFNEEELSNSQLNELENNSAKLDLLSEEEKQEMLEIFDKYEKKGVYLGTNAQKEMLLRGWAVHHAGRLPQYKKLIEELFSKKLIKVVIATSTLGAGINMPAKTVVMTNTAYKKYNPQTKEVEFSPLSANEFHQMAGRAGRRGIDKVGHVVLYNLHTPQDRFRTDELKDKNGKIDELWLAYKLMDSDADDLRSSFRPQAPMLAQYYLNNTTQDGLTDLIKQSFRYYCSKDKLKAEKQMFKKFENYTQILMKEKCLYKNNKKQIHLTPKGEILAQAQGLNPLVLTELLYEEELKNIMPNELCQIVAHIQGSEEQIESEASANLVNQKIEQLAKKEHADNFSPQEFESTKTTFKKAEEKIQRALKEGNIGHSDIKTTDSFSGLVGYLFASYNELNDNSIANFKKIVDSVNTAQSSDAQVNKEYERKATEGNIYKIITGSISTLKQIINICDYAISYQDKFSNTKYWENLKETAQEAIYLLDREPINNNPEYAN